MLRLGDYTRDLRRTKWGSGVSLHGSNPEPLMSALGQKQTLKRPHPMSALPPKADIDRARRDVRFVPKAAFCACGKTGAGKDCRGNCEADGLGGLESS